MKPISVIVSVDFEGSPKPLKFKYVDEIGEARIIKVDNVISREKIKLPSKEVKLVCRCASVVDGIRQEYILEYYFNTCKWVLRK